MTTVADRVRAIVDPIVASLGLEVFDVEHAGGVLRVTVESEGGVDLDEIASLTRSISRALDDADPIPGHYTLEVSSPGLERALRTPAHFAWAVGRPVAVKTKPEVEGERRVTGTVEAADDEGVELVLDGPAGARRRLRYDEIEKARTTFEWGPTPKPGGPARAARTRTEKTKARAR